MHEPPAPRSASRSSSAPRQLGVALLGVAWLGAALGASARGGPAEESALGRLGPGAGSEVAEAAPAREPVRYGRDVRPLLSDRCFHCHGPDEATREAGLRLDVASGAYAERDGIAAVVPGDLEASELWYRVSVEYESERMPPAESNKHPLSAEELAVVQRWIEAGAEYEEHWAFEAPARGAVPAVSDPAWVRDEFDAFVLARLEVHGIAPSPPADPSTLLRRVFLDLTGLPPSPEERAAFLADARPDAYERLVDRLLGEEPYVSRYAERMATPWLDAARYADTCGIHMDAGRQMWLWRDWVLAALRDGMPYDRFVVEQLAGDLLPDATVDQKIASGFNRNHVTTDEGGAIAEEYLVEYAVDRTATTGEVFLGLTLGCARCHDHKYDPVSQEEFYGLYAYFSSIDEPGLYTQETDSQRAFEPFLEVPTPAQAAEIARLEAELDGARAFLAAPVDGEATEREAFFAAALERAGLAWADARVVGARSEHGATLEPQPDGSVVATGESPDADVHVVELETDATDLRLVALTALPNPARDDERAGRAPNGNAVLQALRVRAVSLADPTVARDVVLDWAWADHEQLDGDYRVVNALDPPGTDDGLGWAVDAHRKSGPRAALFLAAEPFGYEGGTRLEVTLDYRSVYAEHVLARVRLDVGRIADAGLDALPAASSGWYATAPFTAPSREGLFDRAFGPEEMARLDTARAFGPEDLRFNHVETFLDERLNGELGAGPSATYVAKRLRVPSAREVEVSLGSDDGFRLFQDGVEVAANEVDRGLAADQDRATLELSPGEHTVLLKVVNTGGPGGFYWRALRREGELAGPLAAALLPPAARGAELEDALREAWRLEFSPLYRAAVARITELEAALAAVRAEVPRTMVMRERVEPRPTHVLLRGQYDHPDESRPVERGIPAALGELPPGAPADRLGLARWLVAPENPLVARVAVNRLWELCFGTGLVATSGDFGLQGEWPSHPALFDRLAVDFRESGWDVKAMVRRLVTSATYRQASRVRPELADLDPDDRLLARYPRRRLSAEQIRDQALYVSGLLVERLGGPSVKPYQPPGLWREVAMLQSNTRVFERGDGEDLWRRSLYTYWKRAAPPPAMLVFDAPTREACTIRRGETATPLQALVLWNDEQLVEAARVLAERTLLEPARDARRLARLFVRCTGREPDAEEAGALAAALAHFRARYALAPADAEALAAVGEAPRADLDPREVAAWTMIANALFSLDATIAQR